MTEGSTSQEKRSHWKWNKQETKRNKGRNKERTTETKRNDETKTKERKEEREKTVENDIHPESKWMNWMSQLFKRHGADLIWLTDVVQNDSSVCCRKYLSVNRASAVIHSSFYPVPIRCRFVDPSPSGTIRQQSFLLLFTWSSSSSSSSSPSFCHYFHTLIALKLQSRSPAFPEHFQNDSTSSFTFFPAPVSLLFSSSFLPSYIWIPITSRAALEQFQMLKVKPASKQLQNNFIFHGKNGVSELFQSSFGAIIRGTNQNAASEQFPHSFFFFFFQFFLLAFSFFDDQPQSNSSFNFRVWLNWVPSSVRGQCIPLPVPPPFPPPFPLHPITVP